MLYGKEFLRHCEVKLMAKSRLQNFFILLQSGAFINPLLIEPFLGASGIRLRTQVETVPDA
jgi:hypothetical protein